MVFRQIYKMLGFIGLLLGFVTTASLFRCLLFDLHTRRRVLAALVSVYSKRALSLFGVKVQCPEKASLTAGTALMVSNHLGYLDVLVLSSLRPCAFVTSVEIRETPFLGWLTQLAGCLYVERRSRQNLSLEISDVRRELEKGLSVCIFPEATSTSGESILRFRRPLYQAAIESGREVQPICINYSFIDGAPISRASRDQVCWYGDMEFLSHLWNFFSCSNVNVEVAVLERLCPKQFSSKELLAEQSYSRVSANFRPLCVEYH